MKYYSILLYIEKNNELAKFCNKKLHELNKIYDNLKISELKQWDKEFNYYDAIAERVLNENKTLLKQLQ
jgi:hypothetical protein